MCGRFTLRTAPQEYWPSDQLDLFVARYNIAPTDQVAAVRYRDDEPRMVMLRWGLVPFWAKDERIGARMINARAESVDEKRAFRSAFQRQRCLVLADGYYEWITVGKKKQPYYIRLRDDRPFAFAGLWASWKGPSDAPRAEPLGSCTVITTESNQLTSDIHDRMPVILSADDRRFWLDPEFKSSEKLRSMLRPYPSEEMEMYPVRTWVNKAGNEGPECIERVPMLFD